MTNQHHNHANEDDNIEDHDNNDWNQKGSPEGTRMRQETAAYKIKINSSEVRLLDHVFGKFYSLGAHMYINDLNKEQISYYMGGFVLATEAAMIRLTRRYLLYYAVYEQ
jgi:hypothetical protein